MKHKNSKYFHSVFISIMAVLLLLALLLPACAEPVSALKLRFSSVGPPPPATLGIGYDYFEQRVTELSDGKITFENYWSGSLLSAGEHLAGIQEGVADLGMGLPLFFPTQFPLANFDSYFPFSPPDLELQVKVKSEMYELIPALTEEQTNNGIKQLFMWSTGSYDLQSTVPIMTLDDLDGKKIAAAGVLVEWFGPTGAVASNIPGSERYVSLQRGTVDGSVMPIISAGDDKWGYEVCKYYTYVGLGAPVNMFLWINLDVWNSLTSRQQDIIQQAADETQSWLIEQVKEDTEDYVDVFKDAGVTFYTMSDADKAEWAEMLPDLPGEWAEEMEALGLPGWEIVETYVRLCSEEGYEWPREWGER